MTLADKPLIVRIRIRDLRKEQALTQEDLADMLGISRQSVIALESGKYMPSLPLAMQLADVFSLPLNQIFLSDDDLLPERMLPACYPSINVVLSGENLIVEAAVAGYSRDEIAVEVEEQSLTISSQPHETDEQSRQYLAQEISPLPFHRQIMLPYIVNADASTATVRDGLLSVTLPLHKTAVTKKRLTIASV